MLCEYGCNQEALFTLKNGKNICSKYSSSCPSNKLKNSLGRKKFLSDNPDKHPKGFKGKTSKTKNKTNVEIYGLEKANIISEKIKDGLKPYPGTWELMSIEAQEAHRKDASERILKRYEDGWMPKAGRCEKYTHVSLIAGTVSVDGTWELAVAKWLDEQQLQWIRNTTRFPYYDMENKLRHYTPDFWIDDWDTYLEIKGYETDLDRCKWAQFPHKLIIWKKQELKNRNILDG